MQFRNYMLDNALIVGDSAGLAAMPALKGVHLAIKSGMLAAQTAASALINNDTSEKSLQRYETLVNNSFIQKELYPVRNFRQAFAKGSNCRRIAFWNSINNRRSRIFRTAEISS